jgi:hypothetical protein
MQTTQHPSLLSDSLMDSKWATDLSWVSLGIAQYFYVDENISCCCWKLTAKVEYVVTRCLAHYYKFAGIEPGTFATFAKPMLT